jgi:hypothetical protein
MKLANAANLNGKSGVAKWRDLRFTEPAIDLYGTLGSHADSEAPAAIPPGFLLQKLRRLDDFPGFDTTGADTDALVATIHLRPDGTKIDIPTALADVVRVRDLVTELRTLAAD